MEAKRTPTPWRAERWTSHAPRTVLADDPDFLTGKRIVAECESDEDAAFIVAACNARDQLVAALKIGRDVMALVGAQDHLIDYDAVSKGRKIVADALAAAGAALVGMDSPASANAGGQV